MPGRFFSHPHVRETVSLAWPLVLTQLGHIVTGMVDNIFLGAIGPSEQAAGILSNNLFVLVLVFTLGMSYASTPLVAAATEGVEPRTRVTIFKNSLLVNVAVCTLCFGVMFFATPALVLLHQPAEVVALAEPFFDVLIFSMLPLSLFFTCKQYCEGLSNTRMALAVSVAGNVINVVLNYILIYGKFGLPALGYMGSAWASFFSRLFMGAGFVVLIMNVSLTREIRQLYTAVRIELKTLRRIIAIGLNSALQLVFEVAAFAIAGLMAGVFGKEQIDAHGIALSLASFTYMFGSGIGSAAAIRFGILKARGDIHETKSAAGYTLKLVVVVMATFGLLFLLFNTMLPLAFSRNEMIVALASRLLIIAAAFQVFDGLQVSLIGVLRGLEDVKVPTVITLVGYWLVALPLAWYLAFPLGLETTGVWIGLLASLVFVSLSLVLRLRTRLRYH